MEKVIPTWNHEFQTAFRKLKEVYAYLEWPLPENLLAVEESYSVFIPRNLAKKIKDQGPEGVLAREFLPNEQEINKVLNTLGYEDPIGDSAYNKAPQLIHRYPSRVLFTATNICPVLCRYCFRKNELSSDNELFQRSFQETLNYIKAHPEISEIIFTGGDPLTLSNEVLEKYLTAFAEIETVRDIRFHTRYPVIIPARLDIGFSELIQKFAQKFRTISIAIHANHVDEFDEFSKSKIKELATIPVQLLSQTVLLSHVNDSVEELLKLYNLFLDLKVRPYYLHHPDRVKGGMHFMISLAHGRKIYSQLRKSLPGWALPQYVLDVPGGEGKISAFNPENLDYSGQILNLNSETITLKEHDFFS